MPSSSDSEMDREVVRGPTSELVICVTSSARAEALRWLVDKIRGQHSEGGAELAIRVQPPRTKGEDLMLHISASKIKLLEAAEQMEFQKEDKEGRLRDFSVGHLEDFLREDMTVDDLITTNERQTIVRHELENIRASAQETYIPGYSTYALHEGQSILQVYQQKNIITQIYQLHDKEALKKLGQKWYRSFFEKQPIEEIREYFGEGIALYCTFLGFYTTALLCPMFLGFIQHLLASTESVPFFCVFNVVWTTVFLEIWKRRSNELAYKWGTIGMTSLDEPRSNYHGQMGRDPVSGKIQPQYPRWKTNAKMYFVSIPIVFICMVLAFIIMLASFYCEHVMKNYESEYKSHLLQVPSIVYAALVYIINMYYRSLATFLTEWENHRTQSQYDRHRVTKLVLFEFVNNFMSLFYIAFFIQDMEMLRNQLAVMLVIQQALNHVQEAFLPLVIRFYLAKMLNLKKRLISSKNKSHAEVPKVLSDLPVLSADDTLTSLADSEKDMDPYEGTFDDYLEMFVQFGYVVLFSSVYPIAAFWAVLNNVVEIRADAFKLCRVFQRPMARKVKDIGAWQRAFEIVGTLSIMTNCGLLALSPSMRSRFGLLTSTSIEPLEIIEETVEDTATRAISGEAWVLGFVILEHILLGVRFLLHKAIPERPEWVRVELARRTHESRRALKNERNQKSRHILTRRFKTIHGPHQHNSSDKKII